MEHLLVAMGELLVGQTKDDAHTATLRSALGSLREAAASNAAEDDGTTARAWESVM